MLKCCLLFYRGSLIRILLILGIVTRWQRLPPAFLKQLTVGESGAALVEDQSNRCWDIELLRRGNDMIFSKGWEQFFEENDLETGDFLVFQYDGELHFTVTIFGKSSCEKNMEKRCPRIKARDAASSFKTTNPSFKIVVMNSHYVVRIPGGFPEANLPKKACWVTLEDSLGRQWFVKYIKSIRSRNGRYYLQRSLSAGWHKFSVENRLKKGNVRFLGGNRYSYKEDNMLKECLSAVKRELQNNTMTGSILIVTNYINWRRRIGTAVSENQGQINLPNLGAELQMEILVGNVYPDS